MSAAVPKQYLGLWRRTGIRRADGSSDLSTHVWWFQSPRFHIDLRIPAARPLVACDSAASYAKALAQLPPSAFGHFVGQSGFAGLTVVDGARCEWRPEIAFPAVSATLDAGWMRFDAADRLHETGLDDSYQEDWVRIDDGPVLGLRLDGEHGAVAYLLLSDQWLAIAHGRGDGAFPEFLPGGCTPAWSEFAFARRDAELPHGWRVVACNNPWREGELWFADGGMHIDLLRQLERGALLTLPCERLPQWRVAAIAHA